MYKLSPRRYLPDFFPRSTKKTYLSPNKKHLLGVFQLNPEYIAEIYIYTNIKNDT
jgi:hypothetical protein